MSKEELYGCQDCRHYDGYGAEIVGARCAKAGKLISRMNECPGRELSAIAKWDYAKSVQRMRPLVAKWKTVTIEMLDELWRARKELAKSGTRTDLVTFVTRLTWEGYLTDIGLNRMTVHRWLANYDPIKKEIREIEQPEPKERVMQKQMIEEPKKEESAIDDPPDLFDEYDDLYSSDEVTSDPDDGGRIENWNGTDPTSAIEDIDNYIQDVLDEIPTIAWKHQVCNELIKRLKQMAIEFDQKSMEIF